MQIQLRTDFGTVLATTEVDDELWRSCQTNQRDAWAVLTSLEPPKPPAPSGSRPEGATTK